MSRAPARFLVLALALAPMALPAQGAPRVVFTEGAPKQIGPYSQGVISNGMLFTAGQTGRDPATGKLVEGGLVAEAQRVFDNLEAVLTAAHGAQDGDVVILSPACSSFDKFKNFVERGNTFRSIVLGLE